MSLFYHGTSAELRPGDVIEPGHPPAWPQSRPGLVYFTDSRKDALAWGRETNLYLVDPTGDYKADDNFPDGVIGARRLDNGLVIMPVHATRRSHQTRHPLRVIRWCF
jgi:rifampin ADP-ribosylating transferase